MAIRTKEQLIDKIGQDYIWRLREISELKTIINTPSLSEIRKKVVCRSGVALLYAHWEGFVKKSGTFFLEYVSLQRHSISELKSNFITLLVRSKIDKASESNKYSAFDEVMRYILENQSTRARIPTKNIIDTQSNLSTTALKEIMWCLGLDYSLYEPKQKLIDTKLVSRRNYVAHGELMEVSVSDFVEMADEVIELMTTFKNLLENACMTESYKVC